VIVRPACPPGELLGQSYSNVRVDVPRALSGRSRRIILAVLRDVLQFIGSDDGRDGLKGSCGNDQMLGRRRGRYSGGRSAHCNFGTLQPLFFALGRNRTRDPRVPELKRTPLGYILPIFYYCSC
jgi:hypothetical protein